VLNLYIDMFTRTFQSYLPELLSIWARTTFDIYWVSTKIFICRIILNSKAETDIVVTDGTTQTQQAVLLICQMNCSEQFIPRRNKSISLRLCDWPTGFYCCHELVSNCRRTPHAITTDPRSGLEQSLGIFQSNCQWSKSISWRSLASDADSDGDLPSLIRLHVYQERNRLNPEADTELNKTRKKCNGISFVYPWVILLKSSSPFKIQRSTSVLQLNVTYRVCPRVFLKSWLRFNLLALSKYTALHSRASFL